MKKILIILVVLLSVCSSTFAKEIESDKVQEPIKKFQEILENEEIYSNQGFIKDKTMIRQLNDFKERYLVSNYSYYILKIKKSQDNYELRIQNRVEYKKKEGIANRTDTFSSDFTITYDTEEKIYVIIQSNFFKTLNSMDIYMYIFLAANMITFPFLVHAFKRKKVKWIVTIIILNLIGAILYYLLEIRRSLK